MGSTSGPDLLVVLDRTRGTRAGVERALRDAIREGRLVRGARLPSSRALARDLAVSRGTVVGAYNQLIAEGWLTAAHGSGTIVAGGSVADPAGPGTSSGGRPTTVGAPGPRGTRPPFPFDLRPGRPDLSAFPRGPWLAASKRVWATAPRDVLDYSDGLGDPGLRTQLAAYLGRVRGVRAEPDQIVVCGGFIEGLALVANALAGLGTRTVAMEDPCLPLHRRIVTRAGLEVVGMPVDAEGAVIDGLLVNNVADGGPLGVVVTPAHQHPRGVALSPARRAALVALARERDAIVVEDDYDGEFRYDREPVGALQGLAPDRVVYAGTASKTLAPALRLGWLVLPEVLLRPVQDSLVARGWQRPVIDQLVLAELIASGGYDRQVRRMRLRYRRRRDLLVTELARRAPTVRVAGIAAGLHVIVELPPDGPGELATIAAGLERGLALYGLATADYPHARNVGPHRPALVVGYATPPEHTYRAAVDALVTLLADLIPTRF